MSVALSLPRDSYEVVPDDADLVEVFETSFEGRVLSDKLDALLAFRVQTRYSSPVQELVSMCEGELLSLQEPDPLPSWDLAGRDRDLAEFDVPQSGGLEAEPCDGNPVKGWITPPIE